MIKVLNTLSFALGLGVAALSGSADSFAAPAAPSSVNWQRLEFERQLQSELTQALTPAIPRSHFVLQLNVQTRPRPAAAAKRAWPVREEDLPKDQADSSALLLSKIGLWANLPTAEEAPPGRDEDVFDLISGVTATLILDEAVTEDKATVARTLITTRLSTYVKQPKIVVTRAKLFQAPPEKVTPPPPVWGPREYAREFKLPLALLLCSFFFIAVLLMNHRGSLAVEREKIAAMAAAAQNDGATGADVADQGAAATGPTTLEAAAEHPAATGEPTTVGTDRLASLIQENPAAAALMVKQWINAQPDGADQALALLARTLTVEQLTQTTAQLTTTERKAWKKILDTSLSADATARAQQFLANQISESILIPPVVMEAEAKEFFASLTPKEASALAAANPRIGAVLLNTLTTIQVARMMSMLSPEAVEKAIASTGEVGRAAMGEVFGEARALVTKQRERASGKLTPFIEKSLDLIREIEPEAEGALFVAMARADALDLLEDVSRAFAPVALIEKLAPATVQMLLNKFPTAVRAELIYTRAPEAKARFLAAIGETGKMRELIDVELSEIDADPSRKAMVQARTRQTWRRFVEAYRESVRHDFALRAQVEPLRKAWLSELTNGKAGGPDALKAA